MRNANRIPAVLEAVQRMWELVPDWRLGQLIVNVSRNAGYGDPFFIEDDKLVQTIENMMRPVDDSIED